MSLRQPALLLLPLALATAAGGVPFTHVVIDPAFHGDCKALGDLDGDGQLDVIVAGARLVWYRYPAWTPTVVATASAEFTTDMQVGDVDRDGDLDVVVPDGSGAGNVLWFENPRPLGDPAADPWRRHVIGTEPGPWSHDLEVGDVDGDGRLDVVTRKDVTTLWLQSGPDAWRQVALVEALPPGEGSALGDLDGDGDLDLALNGYWLECPDDPADGAAWVRHPITAGWPDQCGAHIADLDRDGRPDVVLAASESPGRLSWFAGPADPRTATAWTEHVIDASVDYVHTFKTADIDGNGAPDVVFAEMAQSSRRRVGYFLNGGDATSWTLELVATTGSHNLRVGDVGSDGDVDIVGANWQGPPVEMWENGRCLTPAPPDLGNRLRAVRLGAEVALGWEVEPAATSYNLYRTAAKGERPTAPLRVGLAAPAAREPDVPGPPDFYLYRVSGVNDCGEGPY